MGQGLRHGARPGAAPCRRPHPRPQCRTVRLETLDTGKPISETTGGGRGLGRRLPGIFRRHRGLDRRRAHRSRRLLRLHAARAAGRGGRHRGLELSDPDRLLEGRAGAGLRQCHGVQAVRADAALGPEAGRDPEGGGPARRRVQRPAGRGRNRSRACRASRRRQGVADRFGADRTQGDGGGRRRHQARHHGTRRQVAADRVRRRRPRQRRRRRHAGQLLFVRPDLLQRHARLRAQARAGRRFSARLLRRTEAIRIGDPLDPATQMGPLVSAAQRDKVLGYIESRAERGRRAPGGRRRARPAGSGARASSSSRPSSPT